MYSKKLIGKTRGIEISWHLSCTFERKNATYKFHFYCQAREIEQCKVKKNKEKKRRKREI